MADHHTPGAFARPVFHPDARVSADDIAAAYGVSKSHFRRDMLPALLPTRIVLSHKVHRWIWRDVLGALEGGGADA